MVGDGEKTYIWLWYLYYRDKALVHGRIRNER